MSGFPPVSVCDSDDASTGIDTIVTTDNIQIIRQLNLTNQFGQPISEMSTVVTDNNGEVVTQ